MRERRPRGVSSEVFSLPSGFVLALADTPDSLYATVALLVYESARVSAPAIWVVVVDETSSVDVESISSRSEVMRSCSIRENGRYLFGSLGAVLGGPPWASLICVSWLGTWTFGDRG